MFSQLKMRTLAGLLMITGGAIATLTSWTTGKEHPSQSWTEVTSGTIGSGNTRGASWADYDNDGDLDLYITNWAQPNKLYQNNGGDSFTEVTTEVVTPTGEYYSGRSVWADVDNDGDVDLFIAQSRDSHLLRNDGLDGFTDITNGEPLKNNGKLTRTAAWGDYDQDGLIDIYISTKYGSDLGNRLLRNMGGGTFQQQSDIGPVEDEAIGRGVTFSDYDNDGDPDIYLANGDSPDGTPNLNNERINRMYRNDGGIFVDASTPPLNSNTHTRGVSWGDYDNDGDLDLYLSAIYVNVGSCCVDNIFCTIDSNYNCTNEYFGVYGGHGVLCEEIICDQFGACCLPDGSCQESYATDCENIGGSFKGDETACATQMCPIASSEGACCVTLDSCVILTESDCDILGGEYDANGTNCDFSECTTTDTIGACCTSIGCINISETSCLELGGSYRGDNSICEEVSCGEPLRSENHLGSPKDLTLMGDLLEINGLPRNARGSIDFGGNNQLFRNDGNGNFAEVTTGDLGYTGHSRCHSWVDFDNDMDLDLLLVNSYANLMLLQNDGIDSSGNPVFSNVASGPFLVGITNANSASWADYDGDGDMDVIVCIANTTGAPVSNRLIRNDLNNGAHWIEIECIGTVSNRSAIGARITVTTNGVSQIREIESGSGYFAAHMLPAHFGLGPNGMIDTLHVRFPNGREVTLTDVPADQKIKVVEPCDIATGECDDCNLNGIPDIQDIAAGSATDFNFNNVLDSCDIATGTSLDCNLNGIPDEYDTADPTQDCNANDIPDSCEPREPLIDCNANGISDQCDIASGSSVDVDENGIPDECEVFSCAADIDKNGIIDIDDFSIMLIEWGCMTECSADINTDGVVDLADFSWFLILFGATCEEEPLRNAPQRSANNSRSRPSRIIR